MRWPTDTFALGRPERRAKYNETITAANVPTAESQFEKELYNSQSALPMPKSVGSM